MATTEKEYNQLIEYVQAQIVKWQGVYLTDDNMPDVAKCCTYQEYRESTKGKKVKAEVSKEVEGYFNTFWSTFPGKSSFEYKGKKFPGERVLKANKGVCLKLYNDSLCEIAKTGMSIAFCEDTSAVLLKALQVQLEHIKIESYKSGQNRMQYMKSMEVYLRQRAYEVYIGDEMPTEPLTNNEKREDYIFNG